MPWNWELSGWPKFKYNLDEFAAYEKQFLLEIGSAIAFLKSLEEAERQQFIIEILSSEGLESSKIEGEILDRKSLQSSIRRYFGLQADLPPKSKKEEGMAGLLCQVYSSFDQPLTHKMLYDWHSLIFKEDASIEDCGKYRTHAEPMQIVSARYDTPRVFFEAPPSEKVMNEMTRFIDWFNSSKGSGVLSRAAIAHVYFESVHPFEDGNGRIGRVLVEKILSQEVGMPVLIAVSKILERRKKEYYTALEKCNKTLDIQPWIHFFSQVILKAQKESLNLLFFLIKKAKMLSTLSGQINTRQEKTLLRMFAEGLDGFKGGLSAENYIAITKTSRATATRDLVDLVEKRALTKTGEFRHTRYWLNLG
jgi:Fic family protein